MSTDNDARGRRLWLYKAMLAAQKAGGGFDLTFEEIAAAWGYKSKSAVSKFLPDLVEAGYVVKKLRSTKYAYRAKETL